MKRLADFLERVLEAIIYLSFIMYATLLIWAWAFEPMIWSRDGKELTHGFIVTGVAAFLWFGISRRRK